MKRRRFAIRFGLRTLLVMMLLSAAFGLGWKAKEWNDARLAEPVMEDSDMVEMWLNWNPSQPVNPRPPQPVWQPTPQRRPTVIYITPETNSEPPKGILLQEDPSGLDLKPKDRPALNDLSGSVSWRGHLAPTAAAGSPSR